MRKRSVPPVFCGILLCACSSIPLSSPDKVPILVRQIQCELYDAHKKLTAHGANPWLNSWAAAFSLTLKSDQAGGASPEVSLLGPFGAGTYALPVGGGISADGVRTAAAKYSVKLSDLHTVDCGTPEQPLVFGSLGIEEWLFKTVAPERAVSYRLPDTVGHTFQFALTYGAHAAPAYTLVRSKGNSGFTFSRTDTDIVDVALTDATPKPPAHVIIDTPKGNKTGGMPGLQTFSFNSGSTRTSPIVQYGRVVTDQSSIPDDARQRLDNQLYELQLRNLFAR